MKDISPRRLALWVALIFTIVFIGLCLVIDNWLPGKWFVFLIAGVLIFGLVYRVIISIIRSFFFYKIRPLYRIVRKSKNPDLDLKKSLKKINPFESIYKDVDVWLKDKNTEIDQLKANEKYRKEFLGNVSHELKTPIFNVQGYILTLLGGGLDDPDINYSYLEKAEKNINRMIQIVRDLEYIAKIESGELELELENFDIIKLIDEVMNYHELRAKGKNIDLKYANKPEKPIMIRADRKRMFDVFNNLIANGIIYGNQGGYVMVDLMDMYKHILVEVSDNGLGINEEHQARIFERFYRIDKSRSRDQGGTGLGLAIVKHLIEAHGHSINIRSSRGEGSSFTFTINKSDQNGKL